MRTKAGQREGGRAHASVSRNRFFGAGSFFTPPVIQRQPSGPQPAAEPAEESEREREPSVLESVQKRGLGALGSTGSEPRSDPSETQAERVGRAVVRGGSVVGSLAPLARPPAPSMQRCACGGGPGCSCDEEKLQRSPSAPSTETPGADSSSAVRAALAEPGRPLEGASRDFMESRFGADFSGVRVHTSSGAEAAASSVAARAFTVGNQIVFNRGQYSPGSDAGKELLAHELTHTIQQGASGKRLQRACDPAALAFRTLPAYFPQDPRLVRVYQGTLTIARGTSMHGPVGLVQQALVDLGHNLGTSGPRGDGVDRGFGGTLEQAITDFQTAEAIPGATPGVLDQPTFRCLDDQRARLEVPAHQAGVIAPDQYRIGGEERGGRDEEIFFARGSAALSGDDNTKLARAAITHQGCSLDVHGFVSEDELVDFGPQLATDRINAVSAKLDAEGHGDLIDPFCDSSAPLRRAVPHADASAGVADYRGRRKVEIATRGARPSTLPCPRNAPRFRPLTAAETAVLTPAITQAIAWLNTAASKLTPGHAEGDPALTEYFGGTGGRSRIRGRLRRWRRHIDRVVRTRNRHGTECNPTCDTAIAFNNGVGGRAQMTVCPRFFGSLSLHSFLSEPEKKAFTILHEAGHGSIGTTDFAYGHRRLIEFLSDVPATAERNTDSYTLMVLCLNGFAGVCSAPAASDTAPTLSATEAEKSRRGLGWLETWLTLAGQDLSGLYRRANRSREQGRSVSAIHSYYGGVFRPFVAAFDIHRPRGGDPPVTLREQIAIAAVRDRMFKMRRAARAGLTVAKNPMPLAASEWVGGGPDGAPGRSLLLVPAYFALTTDRQRVEDLLPLIVAATAAIEPAMKPKYVTFVKEDIRRNRSNLP